MEPQGAGQGRPGGLRACDPASAKPAHPGRPGQAGHQSWLPIATGAWGSSPSGRDGVPDWGRWGIPRGLSLRLLSQRSLRTGRAFLPGDTSAPAVLPASAAAAPPTASSLSTDRDRPLRCHPVAQPRGPGPGTTPPPPRYLHPARPPRRQTARQPRRALRACALRSALCPAPSRKAPPLDPPRPRHAPSRTAVSPRPVRVLTSAALVAQSRRGSPGGTSPRGRLSSRGPRGAPPLVPKGRAGPGGRRSEASPFVEAAVSPGAAPRWSGLHVCDCARRAVGLKSD